jgi:predicted DNA binding CopG/RHH family protein
MADFSDLGANTSTTSGFIRNGFSFRLADFANLQLARYFKLIDDPDHVAELKKQITIRLDEDSIDYFKGISEQVGILYQSLINLYLRDCAAQHRKLDLSWK